MHHVYGDSLDIYNNLGESIEHRLIFSVPLLKSSVYFEQKSAIVLACLVGYGADLSQDYSSRISATCSEGRHLHREGIGGGVLATVGAWIAGESRHLFLLLWQRISCITPVVSTDYWNDCRQSHAYAGALLSELTVKGRYLDERVHLLLIWPALSSGMPICTMLRPLWVR